MPIKVLTEVDFERVVGDLLRRGLSTAEIRKRTGCVVGESTIRLASKGIGSMTHSRGEAVVQVWAEVMERAPNEAPRRQFRWTYRAGGM